MKRKRFSVFIILLLILSACSSDADKAALQNNREQNQEEENLNQPGKEQNQSKEIQLEENLNSLTEIPKLQEEMQSSEESSNLDQTDREQSQTEENLNQTGEEQSQPEENPSEDKVPTWQSAYLEVIYHLWDYLAPRYYYDYSALITRNEREEYDDPMNVSPFYLGLHDFDGDNILELIVGDGRNLAVFTYEDGCVKKIADLYDFADTGWCVNGVMFKDNSIHVGCAGAGVVAYVNLGYMNGKYVLGIYNEICPANDILINGELATREEVNQIYTLDYNQIQEEELKERLRLVNENGIWILKHYHSEEEAVLDMNFDFDSILW